MTSQIPASSWQTGLRHESLRILYYLKRLPEKELQQRGFLVLPSPSKTDNRRTVVIPDLEYSTLWQPASRLIPTTPMTAPQSLIDKVAILLSPTYVQPVRQMKDLQRLWSQNSQNFFHTLYQLLPDYRHVIKKINFIVVHSGTISQFNIVTTKNPILTIYVRPDTTLLDIFQVIILSLIRNNLQNQESRTWQEIESISDFLLHHTSLKDTYPESSKPMIHHLRQQQSGKLIQKSQIYQSHLGIPVANNWRIDGDKIYYQDTKIDHLTFRQSKLMKLLIHNFGEVVSLDDIASLLWPDGQGFSLWAMVKEVARVREHLKSVSLPGSLIQTHRKLGYSLH